MERIRSCDFDHAGFTLDGGLKDIRLILDAAAEAHVPLACASLIEEKCMAEQARGFNQHDLVGFRAQISPGRRPEAVTAISSTRGEAHR